MNCFLTVVANLPARTTSKGPINESGVSTETMKGAWSIPGPRSYTAKSAPNLIPGVTMNPLSLRSCKPCRQARSLCRFDARRPARLDGLHFFCSWNQRRLFFLLREDRGLPLDRVEAERRIPVRAWVSGFPRVCRKSRIYRFQGQLCDPRQST